MKKFSDFPPEFDVEYYKARYSELGIVSNVQAEAHFRDHGMAAGLEGSPLTRREEFIKETVGREEGDALEIGPFCSPILRGPHVAYLDAFDAAELRVRAKEHGINPDMCPTVIDFVGDIASVDRQFAYVLSSHSIEHQPDLVYHLKCVSALLKPGGRYYLIIPDKRFCFDVRKAESTIAAVMQANKERRSCHTLQSVIEGVVFSAHNDAGLHWQMAPDPVDQSQLAHLVRNAIKQFDDANGGYIDVHAWYFTPSSFRSITATLFELGLTGLQPVRVFNTPRGRSEFCAILEKW